MPPAASSRSRRQAASRGVAAIEFVIVLPVLLLMFFGMINLSQFISTNRKLNTAADLVADLVSRHTDVIPATAIDDYFIAVELSLRPLDVTNVRISLYDFNRNSNGAVTRRWTKSSNGGEACTVPDPAAEPIASLLTNGNDIVVAVVCTSFEPPSNYPGAGEMFSGLSIEKRVITAPRQSQTLVCNPANCP